MCMLAYGISADAIDDYVRIDESKMIECLKRFGTNVILIFESEYLRKPNSNNVQRLLKMGEDHGFPVSSSDLWTWHVFFGVAGSNNDIKLLDRSPVFDEVLEGCAPEVNYNVNG
ncbi:uncharacterized protein LOC141659838 [Apium graveolens]|uniref:uncharacterized protein LOC141659838 n=1 Tax=Apium graveolens TaxID=4045 RepID=UPI003D7B7577